MIRNPNIAVAVAAFGFLFTVYTSIPLKGTPQQSALGEPPVVIRIAAQPAAQGFVGEDACRSCHRAEVTQFHKTPHAELADSGQRMNCETCHGAGKAHADAEEA